MSDTANEPGTWTMVYMDDGACFDVMDSMDRVDAAITEYVDSGGRRESLVNLMSMDGDPLRLLASRIVGVGLSTPAGRLRKAKIDHARHTEWKSHRAEAGFPPGDEF